MNTASPRLRMSIVGVVVVGCFVALFARLWYLQVMEAPKLQTQASANRTRTVSVEAPRGRILDVNGFVLVDNRTSRVVTVDRNKVAKLAATDRTALVEKLAATFTDFGAPTKIDALEKRLADTQYDDLQPVPVATDVTEDLMVYTSEHAEELPGVAVEYQSVRKYNFPGAGNIVGYVGRITKEKLAAVKDSPGVDPDGAVKTYQPGSTIGLAGIEATYEDDLRGTPGSQTLEIDAKGRPVRVVERQEAKPGSDVQLNIDVRLQLKAEEALREQLDVTRGSAPQSDRFGNYKKNAPAGSAVVLDPDSGAVRALATFPNYDPDEFVGGISQERYDQLSDASNPDDGISALFDRAIGGQYAPGSTFKLVTATAAVNNGLINRNTTYVDKGVYRVGNRDFGSTGANGQVNLPRALTVSSDVYFYWLGDQMNRTTDIQDTAAAFGFDALTGIDLPNEAPGLVLTPAEMQARHDKNPDAFPEGTWFTGDNVQLAIGQNVVAVTPIQLAGAYAALANGGTVYQPHVAARILRPSSRTGVPVTDPDTAEVVRTIDPVVRSQVSAAGATRDPIVEGLSQVTRSGTAASSFEGFDQNRFPIVGKTGTAQVNGKADTSVFASYAPEGAPRYAVAAMLEESGFGSSAAAPVVRHLYEQLADQEQTGYTYVAPAKQD